MALLTPVGRRTPVGDRFATDIGWLDSKHSFSFGQHYDPGNTHFGLLLVNNDDVVAPGSGFETHPHRDMEIVTWVLRGELVHQDSQGHNGLIYPGLAQRMSAGTGILHSEKNDSWRLTGGDAHEDPVHFVQMWVRPGRGRHRAGLRAARDRRRAAPRRPGPGRERAARAQGRRRDLDRPEARRAARRPAGARRDACASRTRRSCTCSSPTGSVDASRAPGTRLDVTGDAGRGCTRAADGGPAAVTGRSRAEPPRSLGLGDARRQPQSPDSWTCVARASRRVVDALEGQVPARVVRVAAPGQSASLLSGQPAP